MRDHSKHICLASEDMVPTMLSKISFNRRTEHVLVQDALGRVTAQGCVCGYDLPNKLGSRIDTIAVYWDDFANGMPDVSAWERGKQWDFANTGTAIDGDFDTCIAIEQVELDDQEQLVAIKEVPKEKGQLTIEPGSRHHKGQLVVAAGTLLTPAKLSALAMAGIAQVEVVAKPRVVFIPTGDELVPVNFTLPLGKTFEANSLMLAGKLAQWGAAPYTHPIIADDWDAIRNAVLVCAAEYDIIVLNAGSSKGSKDFNIEILDEVGEVLAHEVNHGPGHHSSYSVVDGTPVVGISGPPAGAEYTIDWYLKPLVDSYLYGEVHAAPKVKAKLAQPLPERRKPHGPKPADGKPADDAPKRAPMFGAKRGKLSVNANGELEVTMIEGNGGKAALIAEDEADCFFRFTNDLSGAPAGTPVEVELRWPYNYPGSLL